jgi:hypothetical protein
LNQKQNGKGYYVYSTIVAIIGFTFLFLFAFLIYDLILKLSTEGFGDKTIIQSILTIIGTVFLGGFFTKNLEYKNCRKLEAFKTQKEVALRIIDLSGLILSNDENKEQAVIILKNENFKVKLFFDDKLVSLINTFLQNSEANTYNQIVDSLKKYFKGLK